MPGITPPDPTPWNVREIGARAGDSPSETFQDGHSTARRIFLVNWINRFDALKWLVGWAETYVDLGVTKLSRLVPQVHPEQTEWIATMATMKGHGKPGWNAGLKINTYPDAEIEVTYEHPPYDVVDDADIDTELDRYVSLDDTQGGAELLQMPGACMAYIKEDNTKLAPVPYNVGRVIPQETVRVTWHRLPENVWTPDSNLYQRVYGTGEADDVPYLGTINTAELLGRPKGTLLFNTVQPKKTRSPTGLGWEWSLTYEFIYKPDGWNWLYFFDPDGRASGWYFVGTGVKVGGATTYTHYFADTVPDNYSLYNARDLSQLFSVN